MQSAKGLSILSEAILAIGVVGIAIMFGLVAGNIIGFQGQGFFTTTQQNIADDISSRIDIISAYGGTTAITYKPGTPQYTLTVDENSTISVQLPNKDVQSAQFQDIKLKNTRIQDADTICIQKQGGRVSITAGNCSSVDLGSFCASGRCINGVCQVDRGETPGNAPGDCSCPDDDPESDLANTTWQPSYDPASYIGGSDPAVTDWGCVTDKRTWKQAKGDKCDYDFECKKEDSSGNDMACNPVIPSASGSNRCCPEGKRWDPNEGPDGACVDAVSFKIVFVPVKYTSDSATYNSLADSTYSSFLEDTKLFNVCTEDPANYVTKEVIPLSAGGACDISTCDVSSSGNCFQKIKDCADQEVGSGNWDRAFGICNNTRDECETESSSSGLCGKSNGVVGGADAVVGFHPNSCSPEPFWAMAVHELGHSFGLPHVNICRPPGPTPYLWDVAPTDVCAADITGLKPPKWPDENPWDDELNPAVLSPSGKEPSNDPCRDPNKDDCRDSDSTAENYLMTYTNVHTYFGPAGRDHIKTGPLDDVINACQ